MTSVEIYTAEWLMEQQFPEIRWTVDGILPEGMLVFVARSKVGKTWIALGTAVAVARGGCVLGKRRATLGDVLYLDLDQRHARRTQRRLGRILRGDPAPPRLHIANIWPQFGGGGLEAIREWTRRAEDPRLVVVDTVGVIWPRAMAKRGENAYYAEYQFLDSVRALASEHEGLCIAMVHHESKADRIDRLDKISGTAAWAAAADTIWMLERQREARCSELYITGKEVEEQKLTLGFDWHVGGFVEKETETGEDAWWHQ